jgi:ferredoxin
MKITVAAEHCVGSGNCVLTEPRIFDQSDDTGTVVLLMASPQPELEANAREAADLCPGQAISVCED